MNPWTKAALLWSGLILATYLRVLAGALPNGGLLLLTALLLAGSCCLAALALWKKHHLLRFPVVAVSSAAVLTGLLLLHTEPAFP